MFLFPLVSISPEHHRLPKKYEVEAIKIAVIESCRGVIAKVVFMPFGCTLTAQAILPVLL
jgi:hypothetical protein